MNEVWERFVERVEDWLATRLERIDDWRNPPFEYIFIERVKHTSGATGYTEAEAFARKVQVGWDRNTAVFGVRYIVGEKASEQEDIAPVVVRIPMFREGEIVIVNRKTSIEVGSPRRCIYFYTDILDTRVCRTLQEAIALREKWERRKQLEAFDAGQLYTSMDTPYIGR